MKKSERRKENHALNWHNVVVALVKGGITALIVSLIFLFAFATAIWSGWLGQGWMQRAAVLACALGGGAGGAIAVVKRREMALILGVGTGAVLFFMLVMVGIVLFEGVPGSGQLMTDLTACLCGGGAAGILGRKPKKKRRR